MSLKFFEDKGVPLDKQVFSWKELVQVPYSKLDDDAFTRIRVILMNGIESESLRFLHAASHMNADIRQAAARVRRVEQHQQTMINWLNPPDQSPLETTLGFEQVAIEVTAAVAMAEPDPYLAQNYRFGLLEDFDHLYRYAALYDRIEGKDANWLLQGYTDVVPGRPTIRQHRHPDDDGRTPYDRTTAALLSKLHALTITAGEHQTHDYYMNIGPTFSDPTARQLYAEIASIEEQHVTQYGSLLDPQESLLEKWLLHEANEVYNYFSCVEFEQNPRIRAIWERFLQYELGQLAFVGDLFKRSEKRDPAEFLGERLPEPIRYESHREYVRAVLSQEVDLSAKGTQIVHKQDEHERTINYRNQVNSEGSPTDRVAADWRWRPGTELADLTLTSQQKLDLTQEQAL